MPSHIKQNIKNLIATRMHSDGQQPGGVGLRRPHQSKPSNTSNRQADGHRHRNFQTIRHILDRRFGKQTTAVYRLEDCPFSE